MFDLNNAFIHITSLISLSLWRRAARQTFLLNYTAHHIFQLCRNKVSNEIVSEWVCAVANQNFIHFWTLHTCCSCSLFVFLLSLHIFQKLNIFQPTGNVIKLTQIAFKLELYFHLLPSCQKISFSIYKIVQQKKKTTESSE